uniref:EF-hand domain-containing protein n=1 Tax=Florenciella parvula TaxID=236787 RepID=A0A7S2D7S8_9STRA|mmetsp:Transcript_9399/g.19865  ORF Transcript_9399/g.19865 Transcript_9399/m.19865 type:complete len:306 (+) Transcript_9399:51-968(+)|eukprot:CAMPEP_0182526444 /NCGR_PEP_ID=MMETSP1323-20130603/3193_1 /TAXON_ID=236787 /ORGANISM="Florenciella parvula, Strain RCC1693" /LENGTH=305 /DNA_ID=CAMNT_0024735301 /DNA_START=38 /DNA_END=955 /DNA_ORIENTATION=-
MGNSAPVADDRVQRAAEMVKLNVSDIKGFWNVFRKCDYDRIGIVATEDFFTKIVQEGRNMFGNAIFELIDAEDPDKLEFGEFLQGVVTYCCFDELEILQFCFFIFDREKNGYIDQDELKFFVDVLHNEQQVANVRTAFQSIKFQTDGKFDFPEFQKLNKDFPTVLYPAFRMQQNMMLNIMGEDWWRQKKLMLTLDKEDQRSAHARMMRREFNNRERTRQKQIRHDMGPVKYYLQPSKRSMFDEKYPPMSMEELELIKAKEREKLEEELIRKQKEEEKRLENELTQNTEDNSSGKRKTRRLDSDAG